jgi:hypothetical protein
LNAHRVWCSPMVECSPGLMLTDGIDSWEILI